MKIPKTIIRNNRKYILVEIYKNFALYQDKVTGYKECFDKFDLGLIKEMIPPPKTNINPEKTKK